MLLIEPPLTLDQWMHTRTEFSHLDDLFADYCATYEAEVLSLPDQQLARIWMYLVRDLEGCTEEPTEDPEVFHRMVERELNEDEFEPSSKVAQLIVLCAFADALQRLGVPMLEETMRCIQCCREWIPEVLILAVDDHFAIVETSC